MQRAREGCQSQIHTDQETAASYHALARYRLSLVLLTNAFRIVSLPSVYRRMRSRVLSIELLGIENRRYKP